MDCIDHNELFTLWSIVADLNRPKFSNGIEFCAPVQ